MFKFVILVLLSSLGHKDVVQTLSITELRVSTHMAEGNDALLGCWYDLEEDMLYSVKWRKDGHEFFRYVPQSYPQFKTFKVPGVTVDMNRSSNNFVALKNLDQNSAGVYRCEVFGEGPNFTLVFKEKSVAVDLLPQSGPIITGLEKTYPPGSVLDVNCTTSPSRPEASLVWYINGERAPREYLGKPVLALPISHPHTYQAKLSLYFAVLPNHYINGAMVIKCQASIPPLYHQETEYSFYDQRLMSPPTISHYMNKWDESGTASTQTKISVVCLLLLVTTLIGTN